MPFFALNPKNVGLMTGGYNFCLLIINLFFTSWKNVRDLNPNGWGLESQVLVPVWGLAYIAAGFDGQKCCDKNRHIWGVFAVEKFVYVWMWIAWLGKTDVGGVFRNASSLGEYLAATFHALYGVGDVGSMALFLLMWQRARAVDSSVAAAEVPLDADKID